MMRPVNRTAALSLARFRPLLVGFLLATLVMVQALAMYRCAQHALHIHKHYGHHHVLAEFGERLSLAEPPAAPQIPVMVLAVQTPVAVAAPSVEGLVTVAAFPRAPPALA